MRGKNCGRHCGGADTPSHTSDAEISASGLCVLCVSSHGRKERKAGGRLTLEQLWLSWIGREVVLI